MGVTICAMLLRACGAVSNTLGYILLVELFPTNIRNVALGLSSAVTYAAGIAGPPTFSLLVSL